MQKETKQAKIEHKISREISKKLLQKRKEGGIRKRYFAVQKEIYELKK